MMHMSGALGVNCTYCHNTQQFCRTGHGSTPTRVTAWHGLNMVKDLNQDYLVPLGPVYPDNRLGPPGRCAQGQLRHLSRWACPSLWVARRWRPNTRHSGIAD